MKQLEIEKTIKLLEKYKLPFSKSIIIKTKEEALKAAKKIKYPLAIKTASEKIIHKTEKQAVKININSEEELERAYDQIQKRTSSKNMLLQKMEYGQEIIIGLKKDSQFGQVIIFGLGGIFTEILKDTSTRICPITKQEAEEMIEEIKSKKLLEGYRNLKPINKNKLINILLKTSQLSEKKEIQELDFNPIIANEKEAKIVDARIMIE